MDSVQFLNAKEFCNNVCRPQTESLCFNYNPNIMLILYIILVIVAGVLLFKFLYKNFLQCLNNNEDSELSGEGLKNKFKKYKKY